MTELVPGWTPGQVYVAPLSGEIVTPDSPTDVLTDYLEDVRDYEQRLRDDKKAVTAELVRRMDEHAKWTYELPDGRKISTQSPEPTTAYDAGPLYAALREMDEVSAGAMDRAFRWEVKPVAAGLKALRKLGGRVAEVIDAHSTVVERERRVSIKGAK